MQFGGQTPLNLASGLAKAGVPIIGTSVDSIDLAEDRERFGKLIDSLGLLQPENGIAFTSGSQTIALADEAPSLYGRGEAGLTLEISERFVFFAEGELLFGDVSGGTGRGGFRLRF